MRRAVVLGGGSPLGRRVAASLGSGGDFASVVGIEPVPFADPRRDDGLEFLAWAPDHRPFAEYLVKEGIDTVVDCRLVADRGGAVTRPGGADVISAMYVGAAISDERTAVRSWVLASSSAFYTSRSYMPLLQTETAPLAPDASDRSQSIAEAEDYAKSVARRLPFLNVAILRLQELAGAGCFGPLSNLLTLPRIPRAIGFDPTIQLLHPDDAASALAWAARVELAGLFNVASEGLLRWSDVIRAFGRPTRSVSPFPIGLLDPILDRLGLPSLHPSLFDLLRYGMAIDIAKIGAAGWRPERDQAACLASLVA
jgi:UDP-glucose 4-epimerase